MKVDIRLLDIGHKTSQSLRQNWTQDFKTYNFTKLTPELDT